MATPGRSTAIIFVICVLAVCLAALYVYGQPGISQPANSEDVTISNPIQQLIATSSLGDWRTQFTSATTSQYVGKTIPKTSTKPSTVTETLGMSFLSRFAELKQANLIDNTDIVNQAVDNMLTTSLDPLKPKTYLASDLKIAPITDATTLDTFSKALAQLIGSYAADTSEFAIMQEFVSNNDPSVLADLDPAIKEQKRILTGLLAIQVPQYLLQDYLNLVNGMSTLEGASESIRATDSDSVRGLIGSSMHVDGAQEITTALSNIYKTLDSNGIPFGLHWEILNPLLN